MTKHVEKGIAQALRAEHGIPVRELARLLGVSQSSVSLWVREIPITRQQMARNRSEAVERRARNWRERNRARRRSYQQEGRARARERDPLHFAGCMLYWAEGAKGKNSLVLANSDPDLMRFFRRFLRESLGVPDDDLCIRINVYLNNGLSLRQIEDHWLRVLGLSRTALRKHMINHFPTSSAGTKRNLPYGVCTLRVLRSTRLTQHIFGAIQEYAGFKEPRWLDGGPAMK